MTNAELLPHLTSRIDVCSKRYQRLLLVVGVSGTGKSALARALAERLRVPFVNLSESLSTALLELSVRQRRSKAERLASDLLRDAAKAADTLIVDNIDILFSPSLALNPSAFLLQQARSRTIVATWHGHLRGDALVRGEPGHPEYVQVPAGELDIVDLNSLRSQV